MIKYKLFNWSIIISLFKISAAIILCIIFFNSCNECGCIDHEAINYNSVADKDDGSCKYCDSTLKQYATKTVSLKDMYSASPHFNQVVANFIFNQDSLRYNDLSCGDNTCKIFLHVESLVNQEMEFSYGIWSAWPYNLNSMRHVIIPANATYNADTVHINGGSPCSILNNSSIDVFLIDGPIVYH
ncbi:MAG: hypothetical protein ABI723_18930 [Bacteroidia bacterium]